MNDTVVTYELENDIALIGLNRPEKRNAINEETNLQLRAALTRANDEAKAGVIFGHGTHFCAGLDLVEAHERANATPEQRRRMRGTWHPTLDIMARGGVPFVAALKGACIGGGLEIASAAHIRVADETAFFALPEGQRGIFVGGGGAVRIQRLLGYGRMADLMLTGRVLTAEESERYNLCQYLTPKGEELERAKSLAVRIAQNAPLTNWAICAGLPRVNDASHDDGLFWESLIGQAVRSPRSEQGLKAFVNKSATRLVEPGKSGDDR
jgi:enoyl-CoA hydratase/carnithine racemase